MLCSQQVTSVENCTWTETQLQTFGDMFSIAAPSSTAGDQLMSCLRP